MILSFWFEPSHSVVKQAQAAEFFLSTDKGLGHSKGQGASYQACPVVGWEGPKVSMLVLPEQDIGKSPLCTVRCWAEAKKKKGQVTKTHGPGGGDACL